MSNTSRKLSSEEVSALMDGLKSGEINSGDGLNNDIEVTSFTFGSDNLELMGDYYALRLINERFARIVRGIFLPIAYSPILEIFGDSYFVYYRVLIILGLIFIISVYDFLKTFFKSKQPYFF